MRDAAALSSRPLPLGGQLVLNNMTTMNGLQRRRRQSDTKGELRRRQRGRRRWSHSGGGGGGGGGGGLILSSLVVCALLLLLLLSTQPHHMCESFTVGRQQHRQQQSYLPQSKQTCPASTSTSASSLVQLNLLKGLVSNVEDEIRTEEELATMNPVDFLKTRQNDESMLDKIKLLMDRMKSSTGDTENKMQLLQDQRTYANAELLDVDHNELAPTLDDLNQKQPSLSKSYWVLPPFRMLVLFGSYFAFPFVAELLKALITISSSEYDIISEQFAPGVGILYGTFVALTLEILYDRQSQVQENSTLEASLLSQVTQNMLSLFRDEIYIAREASQIVADQVRIIVKRTRGAEMLSIMRADPYARILSLVDHYQKDKDEDLTPQKEALIDCLRAEIPQLMEARARRLSDEASALPPTHFLVLSLLTGLSLIGFTTATLTITDEYGRPPQESCLVFAALTAIYVLFYNFCKDLNDPFDGVYQIKRSSAASYLLQIKWIIANQSFGNEVRFDDVGAAQVYDGVEGEEWTAAAVVSGGGVINNNVVGVEDGYDYEEDDEENEEAPLFLNGDTSSSRVEERVNGTNESMDSIMAETTTSSSTSSSSSGEILTSSSSLSPLMEGVNTNGLAPSAVAGTTEKTSSTPPPPPAAVVKAVTREFGYISSSPREKEQQQQEQQHTMESKTGKGGTKEKEDSSAIVQTDDDEATAMSMTSEQHQQQHSVTTHHIVEGMNEEEGNNADAAAVTHSSVTKKEEEALELVAEKTAAADGGKAAAAATLPISTTTAAAAAKQSLATEETQPQTSDPVVATVTETAVVGSGKEKAKTLVSDAVAAAVATVPVHTESTTTTTTKEKDVATIALSSTTHTASKSTASDNDDYATAAKLYFRSMGGFGGSDSGSGQTKAATNVLAKREEEKRISFQERVRIRDDKQRRKAEADSAAVRAAAATDAAVEKQQKEGKARVSIVKEEGNKTKAVATGGSEAAAVADAHHGTKKEHNVLADHKGTAVKLEDTHNVVEDNKRVVKVTGQTSKDESRLVKEVTAEEERAKAKTGAKEQEEDAKRLVEEEKAKTEAEAKAKAAQEEEEERRLAAEAEAKAKEAEEEEAKRAAAAAAEEEEARRLAAEEEKAKAAAKAEEEAARAAAAAAKEAEAQKKRQQQQQQEKEDAKLKPMKDRATGIQFEPKIGPDLYLTGVGVRKKAIINIYSVAMYTSRDVKATLATLSRSNQSKKKMALDTLRTETKLYPTSFVLQMAFKVGAEQMASAIAESVAPRHTNKGDNTDVEELKKLIFDGVSSNTKGATKGTTFQFDCYPNEGVNVTVNGIEQGMVPSSNLSDSFCDVYLDDRAVSPALRENCLQNWCEP